MGIIHKLQEYLKAIFSFWASIFWYAVLAGIVSAISIIGAETVINFFAYLIALRSDPTAKLADYYGPHYFDGAITFFSIAFVVFLIHGAAQKYRRKETDVARFSLDNIFCEVFPFSIRGINVVGLKIYNKKPVDIYDVECQISEIWFDGKKSDREFIVLSFGGQNDFMSAMRRNLIPAGGKDVISIALIAETARIAIQPEIHIETDWSTGQEVVKKKEDRARHFYLETNKKYFVKIRMNAVIDRDYPAKAKHIFTGNLVFDGKKLELSKSD